MLFVVRISVVRNALSATAPDLAECTAVSTAREALGVAIRTAIFRSCVGLATRGAGPPPLRSVDYWKHLDPGDTGEWTEVDVPVERLFAEG